MTSNDPGSVVLSLDAELAWGRHDLRPKRRLGDTARAAARRGWYWLVDRLDVHGVPATWAVVGHLLAAPGEDVADDHPLPDSWFEAYRNGAAERPEDWYAPDMIAAVANADVDHEIASHSFTHPVFDEVSRAVVEAECNLTRTYGARHGLDLTSFVFPRNRLAYRDILADHGFRCYRARRPYSVPAVPGLRGAVGLAGAATGAAAPPVVSPRIDGYGLVALPASLFVGGFRGGHWRALARIADDPAVRLAKLGVERARREGGVFHLWLHPNDLRTDAIRRRIDAILTYIADRRDETGFRVRTMDQVARRILADPPPPVA